MTGLAGAEDLALVVDGSLIAFGNGKPVKRLPGRNVAQGHVTVGEIIVTERGEGVDGQCKLGSAYGCIVDRSDGLEVDTAVGIYRLYKRQVVDISGLFELIGQTHGAIAIDTHPRGVVEAHAAQVVG